MTGLRTVLIFLLYLLVFVALDVRSHNLETIIGVVAWYPPDGLSFAFILAFGSIFLPGVVLASFISNVFIFLLPLPLSEIIGWAIFTAIIYGAGAWILKQRIRIDIRLRNTRDLLWFIALTSIISTILALTSVSASVAAGVIPQNSRLWAILQWWIGEVIGVLVITPALLVHVMPRLKNFTEGIIPPLKKPDLFSRDSYWVVLEVSTIIIAVYLAFIAKWPGDFHPYFLVVIPAVWIALRNGLSGSSLGNVLINFGITWSVQKDNHFDPDQIGQLQFMMLIIFSLSLLIGAIVSENRRLETSRITELARRRKKIVNELIIIIILASATWLFEYTFNFFYLLSSWGSRNYMGVVEETLASIMVLGIAAAIFSYRRWKEVQVEIREREKTQIELQDLYLELETRVHERTVTLLQTNELLKNQIAERKIAEEALAQNEKRFEALLTNSADAITLLDENGVAVYDSPAALGMLGYYNNELIGQNIFTIIHEEDLLSIRSHFIELLEKPGARLNIMFRIRHKNGSWRWLEAITTNLLTEPSVKAVVVNYRDITDRKQAEQTLLSAQELYRILFEQSADAVFILDLQGRHVEANQRASEMLGYSHEELLQLTARDVSAEESESMNKLSILLEGQVVQAYERRFRRKDGTLIEVEPHVTLLRDQNGQPFRIQSIVRDISERKQAEREIQNRSKELSTLYELSRALAEANDLEKVLELVTRKTVENIRITFARIALLESDDLITRSVYPIRILDHDLMINSRQSLSTLPFCQRVLEQDQPVIVRTNSQQVGGEERHQLLLDFTQTLCLIPLRVSNFTSDSSHIVGLLMLGESRKEEREPFTPNKLRLARSIGDQAAIAINNVNLFKDLQQSNVDLNHAYEATIAGWSAALDLRDKETEGHTQRVTGLTARLAKMLEICEEDLIYIRYGALLHDIGKMGIPDRILLKPGKLSEDELEIMRMHPTYAFQMLEPITYLGPALDIPYCHHEKWDGTGYPRGLKGEQIPRAAQIFAIVDVYDALTSNRPYRTGWSREQTLEHISGLSGSHFNPQVVDAFIQLMTEK